MLWTWLLYTTSRTASFHFPTNLPMCTSLIFVQKVLQILSSVDLVDAMTTRCWYFFVDENVLLNPHFYWWFIVSTIASTIFLFEFWTFILLVFMWLPKAICFLFFFEFVWYEHFAIHFSGFEFYFFILLSATFGTYECINKWNKIGFIWDPWNFPRTPSTHHLWVPGIHYIEKLSTSLQIVYHCLYTLIWW